jgi:hypothetical protein
MRGKSHAVNLKGVEGMEEEIAVAYFKIQTQYSSERT